MKFTFNCPKCNQGLEAEDEWRGQQTACPSCGTALTIPSAIALKPVSASNDGILYKAGKALGNSTQEQNISMLCPHCEKNVLGKHLNVIEEIIQCPHCKSYFAYSAIASSSDPIVIIRPGDQYLTWNEITVYAYGGITADKIYEAFRVLVSKSNGKLYPKADETQWATFNKANYYINTFASKNQSIAISLGTRHIDSDTANFDARITDIYPRLAETIWGIKNVPGFEDIKTPAPQRTAKKVTWVQLCVRIGLFSYGGCLVFGLLDSYILAWILGSIGSLAFIVLFTGLSLQTLLELK